MQQTEFKNYEEKKSYLDWLFYKQGRQASDYELCYLDQKTDIKHKWRKYSELCFDTDHKKNKWFVEKANNRTILKNEVVFDLEEPERYDEIIAAFTADSLYYRAFSTGSRGFHFHLLYNRELTEVERMGLIKKYGCDTQKASDRCMIALEFEKHWKTGKPKMLVKENKGINRFEEGAPAAVPPTKTLSIDELSETLGLTIKQDKINKIITFFGQLSAYTDNSQINISNNAPSSTGKSYIPLEIAELFPKEDVIDVGYCSPTAFFHDFGKYDKELKGYIVDLERKILIFLDQPHNLLLQHLRPLLSHDQREIKLKITDKSQKHGLRTKNIIIRGFPSVIFCTAGLNIDEQEATRFILLSPETTKEKIREGIIEKIKKEADQETYFKELEENPERKELKDRIFAIKEEQITQINISPELRTKITKRFLDNLKFLKPRHQRDIGRLLSFTKLHALLNLWFRKRENSTIEAIEEDVEQAFKIWDEISESQELSLPPYIYNIYKEVILPIYSELDRGIGRNEILSKHFEVYGRSLPDWLVRQQIIPMLINSGLVYQEPDPNDKRRQLLYPTLNLTIVSDKEKEEQKKT